MNNITSQNLTELIKNIKDKKISSEEVTKSFIENAEKAKTLNCYITEDFDSAINLVNEHEDFNRRAKKYFVQRRNRTTGIKSSKLRKKRRRLFLC